MPARRGDSQFDYPEYAEFHLRCNPGYDFVRFIGWLEEAPPEKFNHVFAAYARNPLGVIIASCAIEGYINYVGHHVDPKWEEYATPTLALEDAQRTMGLVRLHAAKWHMNPQKMGQAASTRSRNGNGSILSITQWKICGSNASR